MNIGGALWKIPEEIQTDINMKDFVDAIISNCLKGVPAFYLPALLASDNDIKAFLKPGKEGS